MLILPTLKFNVKYANGTLNGPLIPMLIAIKLHFTHYNCYLAHCKTLMDLDFQGPLHTRPVLYVTSISAAVHHPSEFFPCLFFPRLILKRFPKTNNHFVWSGQCYQSRGARTECLKASWSYFKKFQWTRFTAKSWKYPNHRSVDQLSLINC